MAKTKKSITFSITQNGKELDRRKYTWDGKTKTLSTTENNLVLDFSDYHEVTFNTGSYCIFNTGSYCIFNTGYNCTFNTGSYCTFNTDYSCTFKTKSYCTFKTGNDCTFTTGSDCIFDTGSDCTFDTGSDCTFKTNYSCTFKTGSYCVFNTSSYCTFNTAWNCTFKTGSYCTFNTDYSCTFNTSSYCTFKTGSYCTFNTDYSTFNTGDNCVAIIRRDIFEVIKLSQNKEVQLCPGGIEGYVKDGYYYKDGKKQYKAIIADRILSEIINHKGNVYKVKNYSEEEITYLVKDGDIYSHGKTLEEARENLKYKISNRDTSMYKGYTLDTEVTLEQAIKMYRIITGACETGVKYFVENNELPEKMTVKELIEITQGQYGNRELVEFFEDK